MTAHRDLKRLIRDRQSKTGESYTAARAHVMRQRAALLGLPEVPAGTASESARLDAVVLRMNRRSLRVRVLGSDEVLTFRGGGKGYLAPGEIVTLALEKRWTFRDIAYATGKVEAVRIDAGALGLDPLPLSGGELFDPRSAYEPVRPPDPYARLWRELTEHPRPSFEMHEIAWSGDPGDDEEDVYLTCDASDLAAAGDVAGAHELLMQVLAVDLRCLDAHAHLGSLAFEALPQFAIRHFEVGRQIGELWLPEGFDGLLVWGDLYNRPFLRCLHGYGLCLWRLGRTAEALAVFERILRLNPNDNQGVRYCRQDLLHGRCWEERRAADEGRLAPGSATAH